MKRVFYLFLVLTLFAFTIQCGGGSNNTDTDDDGDDQATEQEEVEVEGTDEGDITNTESTPPTITELKDADDIEIDPDAANNTTRLSALTANTYTVTFDETMDTGSLNENTIVMTCDGQQQVLASIDAVANGVDDIQNNEFTLTMADQLPEYTDCSLTFTDDIMDLDGDNLEEVAYDWDTLCSSSTEFDSQEALENCWIAKNIPSGAELSLGSLVMDFTTVNSSTDSNMPFLYKIVTGDFEVVLHVSSRNSDEGTEEIGIMFTTEEPAMWDDSVHVALYFSAGFGDENVYANNHKNGSAQSIATATTYTASELYLKMVRVSNTITVFRSTDGTNWTSTGGPFTNMGYIGQTGALGIFGATGNTSGDFSVTIDSFDFNSGTADGQD